MKKLVSTFVYALVLLFWAGILTAAQESSTARQTTTTTTTTKKTVHKPAGSSAAKLDLNSASKEELEQLPGIGPVTAQKIIDDRPYRAKSDLVNRKVVSAAEYSKIKNSIVAHQPGAAK